MSQLFYWEIAQCLTHFWDYINDAIGSKISSVYVDNQAAGNYGYDNNGNTIKDTNGKIGFIQYDITNHPIRTFLTTGQVIDYFYDPSGNIVRKYEGINDLHVL